MTEPKEDYGSDIEVTIDFDKLPNHIGKVRDGRRLLRTDDTELIIQYIAPKVESRCDVLILEGYLPPGVWAEIGAFVCCNVNPGCRVKYRAQNGFTCDLPYVSAVA